MRYKYNQPVKHKIKIPILLFVLIFAGLFSVLSTSGISASDDEIGVVTANYVSFEHDGAPDDYTRLLLLADDKDGGFFRIDRAPVTEEWTPELIDQWRVFWLGGTIKCTNITEKRAVMFGVFDNVGDFPNAEEIPVTLREIFQDKHVVFEFNDNGNGDIDDVKIVLESDPDSGTEYTVQELRNMCSAGTIGDASYLPQSTYHSGDVAVYQTDKGTYGEKIDIKNKYTIPDELDRLEQEVGDLGVINHGCFSGLYTLADGKFKDTQDYTFYPNQAAFEAGEPGSFLKANIQADYTGLWSLDTNFSTLYRLFDNTIGGDVFIWPDGTDLSHMQWEGRFTNEDTNEVNDWWNIDVVNNGDGVASGISEGTCGEITNWDTYDDGSPNQ